MSKLANKPLEIIQGVEVNISDSFITVKGKKGTLEIKKIPSVKVELKDNKLFFTKANDDGQTKAYCGLVYRLLRNAIEGVTNGFKKSLKLVGTGYRVAAKGDGVELSVGYSHKIEFHPTQGVTLKVEGNDLIHIEGFDKQMVGQVAADIRAIKPPEPYQGKGIRYTDEIVRKKPGKAASTAKA